MDYDQICKSVLDIDPKVRFAGICDETGETKYGGMEMANLVDFRLKNRKNLICKRWVDGTEKNTD